MFLNLFTNLRAAHLPVSLREYLTLLGALQAQVVIHDVNGFYYLARAALVKDERHLDLFDQVFAATFQGFEDYTLPEIIAKRPLPDEWLQKLAEKLLSPEEMAKVQALGGFEALMKTLWRLWLQPRRRAHRSGQIAPPARCKGVGQARLSRP